jgi:hypothetical protein
MDGSRNLARRGRSGNGLGCPRWVRYPSDRVGIADASASRVRANHVTLHRSKTASLFAENQLRPKRCSVDRDFVAWCFSAAGCISAWIDRHPGGRKSAQLRTCRNVDAGRQWLFHFCADGVAREYNLCRPSQLTVFAIWAERVIRSRVIAAHPSCNPVKHP